MTPCPTCPFKYLPPSDEKTDNVIFVYNAAASKFFVKHDGLALLLAAVKPSWNCLELREMIAGLVFLEDFLSGPEAGKRKGHKSDAD